jgi:hypothetical protein
MQTRTALQTLSKGEHTYGDRMGPQLLSQSDKYINAYNEIDRQILARRESLSTSSQLPFVETLRKKIAKLMDEPNGDLPVITRYDLYTGVRKVAERAPADAGLSKAAALLERSWHQDPLGTLTYKVVAHLMNQIKDQYPRSKARDAIEAECARVGLHKLPVAKLARIASKIDNQADYDLAMQTHGFGGSRPEQVRSRALVRDLVALRGAAIDARETKSKESRDLGERVGSKVADLQKRADYQLALDMLADAQVLANKLSGLVDKASMEAHTDGADDVGAGLAQLSKKMSTWVSELGAIGQHALPLSEDQVDQMVPKKEEPEAPSTPGKSVEQQDADDAGIGPKKLYDPRTWFKKYPGTASLLDSVKTAAPLLANELGVELSTFAERLAQFVENEPLKPQLPEDLHNLPNDLGAPLTPGDGQVQPQELEQGVEVVEQIQDAADQIIQEAPPEAMDYIDHEMTEGHSAPPGTAEWGAEEILNEGHDAPPPTDQWLQEEMEEMGAGPAAGPAAGPKMMGAPNEMPITAKAPPGMEDVVMKLKKQYPSDPEKAFATAWSIYNRKQGHTAADEPNYPPFTPVHSPVPCPKCNSHEVDNLGDGESLYCLKCHNAWIPASDQLDSEGLIPMPHLSGKEQKGKGIPLPGHVKTHPKVTTYAKEVGQDGGQVLKASQIEDQLLLGKPVKVGNVSISVNHQNEIELWNKTSGRACDLLHMDTAIADFMAMVKSDEMERRANQLDCVYDITQLVNVPCESCGDITLFEKAADIKTGQYACPCGHTIVAATVDELMRTMPWVDTYDIKIKYGNERSRKAAINSLRGLVGADAQITDSKKSSVLSTIVANVDHWDLSAADHTLNQLGGRPWEDSSRSIGTIGNMNPRLQLHRRQLHLRQVAVRLARLHQPPVLLAQKVDYHRWISIR